jgi:mono/diheme cytochrome c family protein
MIAALRRLVFIALIAPVVGGFCAPARAADAAHGGVIAKRWCAACHVVAADQRSANSDAPPFADIARRLPDNKAIAAFLADPHPKMPDMSLTRREIEDIVAYIRGLGPTPPGAPAEPGGVDVERPKKG